MQGKSQRTINLTSHFSDHFVKVMNHSSQNRMAEHNLAVVFGPTLIGAPDGNAPTFENTLIHNNIIQTLLHIYPKLLRQNIF